MAEHYCVWVVSPQGYHHAFDEIALGLQCAFRELGYEAPIVRTPDGITGRPIVLGCNLIPYVGSLHIPEGAVMYNLEQIQPSSPWLTPRYIDLLRSYEVWDYSRTNMEQLARLGVDNVRFCGIGYVPALTRIPATPCDSAGAWCSPGMKISLRRASNTSRRMTSGIRLRCVAFPQWRPFLRRSSLKRRWEDRKEKQVREGMGSIVRSLNILHF